MWKNETNDEMHKYATNRHGYKQYTDVYAEWQWVEEYNEKNINLSIKTTDKPKLL